MNRSLFRIAAYLQLGLAVLFGTGCAPTQPFFLNESPELQHYINAATRIEYPDVDVDTLAETTQAFEPLTIGSHDYEFWNLTLEECVSIALQNAKFFVTTSGNAEFRQNVAAQFTSASADQLGSIYDVAITQSTTQSIPLTIDGNGNRTLPRGVLRANQIGGVEDALAEFDAQASSFINYSTTDRAQNTRDSAVSRSISIATDSTQQSALSKRFATGGVATLRQQTIYSRNNLPVFDVGPPPNGALRSVGSDWTALVEAQVQHPLMRNRGTMINRIPVVLASLNEDVSIADFEIQVRNLVRDIEVAYWNLYVAYRNVSTAIIGRNSAIATSKFAQLNLDNGTGTIQEVAQANGQFYSFRALLESALAGSNLPGDDRFGVYGSERVLRELLGITATDGRLIRPIDEPSIARMEFDWTETITQMLYLSPELRRGRTVIKQRELEQISAKNQLLPEVNLSLLYRWVGVGDTLGPPERNGANFPAIGSSALAELTEGNYQEGAVRLEFTPTAIGSRRERARIRGSQLRLQQSRAYLQEAERLMVSQLSSAVANTATHYRLAQTHAQRWQAAEQEVEARLVEFKGGRSPVNVVLQSQQRRAEAQIAYYRAVGEYNKSINYVDYLKGTMLANSNITLAEGPWNKKAYWDALERARERSAGKKGQYGVSRPGVVRRGPVLDAQSASHIVGSGTQQDGANVISDDLGFGEATEAPGPLQLQAPSAPIDVNDIPLDAMGDSPIQLLDDSMELIPTPDMPARELSLPSTERQLDEPLDDIEPISFESPIDSTGLPQPVRRVAIPNQ